MLEKFARNWWLYAVRGFIAVIFGIVALTRPEQTLQALVLVFGAFALADGFLTVFVGSISAPYFKRWWAVLLEGVAGILVGLMAIFQPTLTGLALLYLIGAWALVTGVFEIVAAIQFRRLITNEWMLVLSGLLSIALSVLLFAFPFAGELGLIWLISIYAIIFGIAEIVFAFRLNGLRREVGKAAASAL